MDTSVLMDTATVISDTLAIVGSVGISGWFQYFWPVFVTIALLGVGALVKFRGKQSERNQAIMDASVYAFNFVEHAAKFVPDDQKENFKKLVEFGKQAQAKYYELTGQPPASKDLKRMLGIAERLVFDSKKK